MKVIFHEAYSDLVASSNIYLAQSRSNVIIWSGKVNIRTRSGQVFTGQVVFIVMQKQK